MTPTVIGFDGTQRERFIFNTTIFEQFFSGTLPPNTIDVQVSVRGASYVADPDLIVFEDTSWSFPNPSAYPDGFELVDGTNEIKIRAILSNGDVTPPCIIQVRYAKESDITIVGEPPTNISIERYDNYVEITCDGVVSDYVVGYNFYGTTVAGGGALGYFRMNLNQVNVGTQVQEETQLSSLDIDENILLDSNGNQVSDPLFFGISTQQRTQLGQILKDSLVSLTEIPETTRTVRTSVILKSLDNKERFSFKHYRSGGFRTTPATIPNGLFSSLDKTSPIYYVVSAIYYDPIQKLQFESSYSAEVVGTPLGITTNVASLPQVSRQDIRDSFVSTILRTQPNLRVEPNSVISDTVIQPFATEVERVRFIMDFIHRSQSFATLLVLDDPNNTGQSQPFSESVYKRALLASFNLRTSQQVQSLIDQMFEQRAQNFGITRKTGKSSIGTVTIFTKTKPTQTINIPNGTQVSGGGATFSTTQGVSIFVNQLASYYNPIKKQWEVDTTAEAITTGSIGNVASGVISSISIQGLNVTNGAAFFGGQDTETNQQLAYRAMNALSSVDTGTERGYLQLAADIVGVRNVEIVSSGHELMQRDLDSNNVHRGGKVDIWIRGENVSTVTDNFAFQYTLAKDIQFEIVGSPTNLIFRAGDSELTEDSPILEMLNDLDSGFSFRNASTGETFDLTDVKILSYNTIQLSSEIDQPSFTYGHIFFGDYRRLDGKEFLLTRQPPKSIVSVQGTLSGVLPSTAYSLIIPTAPLSEGYSVRAKGYLKINGYVNDEGQRIPSGQRVVVSDESHTVLGSYSEYLNNLGIDELTVVIKSLDGLTTYRPPNHPSGVSDYTFVLGDETTPLGFKRTDNSAIKSGETLLVSYQHDETFTVTYDINSSIKAIQDTIDSKKHITADVLVKGAIAVPVDIELTVALSIGASPSTTDRRIRTNLQNFFNGLRLGEPVRQSDIVEIVDGTSGVSYVVIPLSRMVRQENALVVREILETSQQNDTILLPQLSTSKASVYLLQDTLDFATFDTGGIGANFRGVFIDDALLENVDRLTSTTENVSSASVLSTAPNRSFIIGDNGAVILGYTDDQTLIDQGYTDIYARQERRKALTQNRVLVSLAPSDDIKERSLKITYYVAYDDSVKNLDPINAEYHTLGDLTITYDEDTALQNRSIVGGY